MTKKSPTKTCSECSIEKPLTSFHKNKDSPDGLHSKCRDCKNLKSKEYYKKSKVNETIARPEGYCPRNNHLKRSYGISVTQYNQLLEQQNHCCAVCGKHESEEKKSLAVDHNHITGEIRGLLCNYCNHRLVGRHRDGNLLRRIADYIEQGTGWFVPKRVRKRRKKKT